MVVVVAVVVVVVDAVVFVVVVVVVAFSMYDSLLGVENLCSFHVRFVV